MDPRVRAAVLRQYHKWSDDLHQMAITCVVCGEPIESDIALHHWLVRRRKDNADLVDVAYNLVPMHNQKCHLPKGQERETKALCLDYAVRALTAGAIAKWYVSLWQDYSLTVPTGRLIPPEQYPLYKGRQFYDIGWRLMGRPPVKPHITYDVRDLAFAKWTGRWRVYRGKVNSTFSLGTAIECVSEGYWYEYMQTVI